MTTPQPSGKLFQLAVIVSALGFFVDVYDLLLFGIIRKPSLAALGLGPAEVLTQGELIISVQMTGLLAGGIIWGILGDTTGRLSVLFGSILLYSLANIANGFVVSVPQYILFRFLAGVGLAGELGAGITLVSELLPKEKRGIAAAFIASFGILGAVTAFLLNKLFDWRGCFFIGGGLGLVLLLLRVSVSESGLYRQVRDTSVERGNFLMFFNNRERFVRYVRCICIGLPAWYIIGVLVTFADQFGKEMGIPGIDPGKAIMYLYLAIAFGDMSVRAVEPMVAKSEKGAPDLLRRDHLLYRPLFLATGRQCRLVLLDLCGARLWYGVYRRLHHHERGTVRDQPEGVGGDQHTQHGSWGLAPDYPTVQVGQAFVGVSDGRLGDRGRLDRHRARGSAVYKGNIWEGPGLRGNVSAAAA